jgi:hypothetical protein
MRYIPEDRGKESAEKYPPDGAGWYEGEFDVDYVDEEQENKRIKCRKVAFSQRRR